MADPSGPSRSDDAVAGSPAPESDAATPRWVKVFTVIAAVVIVLVVVMLLAGGHGPGRHTGSGRDARPSGVVERTA